MVSGSTRKRQVALAAAHRVKRNHADYRSGTDGILSRSTECSRVVLSRCASTKSVWPNGDPRTLIPCSAARSHRSQHARCVPARPELPAAATVPHSGLPTMHRASPYPRRKCPPAPGILEFLSCQMEPFVVVDEDGEQSVTTHFTSLVCHPPQSYFSHQQWTNQMPWRSSKSKLR